MRNGAYHYPLIPGHEMSGRVEGVGRQVDRSFMNRKVAVFPSSHAIHANFVPMVIHTSGRDITVYAKWIPLYAVGDSGPAGGLVFHDKGNYTDERRYLEAAPSDIGMGEDPDFPYYHIFGFCRTETDGGSTVVGTATGIGAGGTNTAALASNMAATAYKLATNTDEGTTESYAVRLSDLHEAGGCQDWFQPSKDELNLMYQNLHHRETPLGGFADSYYWSSSENGGSCAWIQFFADGNQSSFGSRSSKYYVRPVRVF